MKEKTSLDIQLQDPQNSLEAVLKTEIEVAEKVAEARDRADKKIEAARKDQTRIKEKIISEARKERDRIYEQEIEKARKDAQEKIASAKNSAESFRNKGSEFLGEALARILNLIISANSEGSR